MSWLVNMKNYTIFAYADFVNLNIALTLHSTEENWSFILELKIRCVLCCSLNHKIRDTYLGRHLDGIRVSLAI